MDSTKTEERSRSLAIRAISFVFLINFTNIYSQIELLWSKQGILSVDNLLDLNKKATQNDTNKIFPKSFFPSIYFIYLANHVYILCLY